MAAWLLARMGFLAAVLFGILYALITIAGTLLGVGSVLVYGLLAVGMLAVQFLIGPKLVEWTMGVRYVSQSQEPELHQMVDDLSRRAGLPKPRIGIARTAVPNAFAFGRWKGDGRVCITEGVRSLLTKDELRAVLGHELSHLKHRDVAIMAVLGAIPLLTWYLAYGLLFSGGSDDRRGNLALLGLGAFALYFLTSLLVMYGSRIREYAADWGSVRLGEQPHHLATALYKLQYGTAKVPRSEVKKVEGVKAFFATDPSRALAQVRQLSQVDLNLSGSIDEKELTRLREQKVILGRGDRIFELLSTHPNMLRRVAKLASYQNPKSA